jgi:hypothetical protein
MVPLVGVEGAFEGASSGGPSKGAFRTQGGDGLGRMCLALANSALSCWGCGPLRVSPPWDCRRAAFCRTRRKASHFHHSSGRRCFASHAGLRSPQIPSHRSRARTAKGRACPYFRCGRIRWVRMLVGARFFGVLRWPISPLRYQRGEYILSRLETIMDRN